MEVSLRYPPLILLFGLLLPLPAGSAPPSLECIQECARLRLEVTECRARCGSPSGGDPQYESSIRKIQSAAQVSFLGAVAQAAAGITQVSQAAQDRQQNGSTEENRQQLVLGLTNLAAADDGLKEARAAASHAEAIEQRLARTQSGGTQGAGSSFQLRLEPAPAGSRFHSVLEEMEKQSGITPDELKENVNGSGNIYELAAKAKGMDLSAGELAGVAAAALAKTGKPANPTLAEGLTMKDMVKDLEMFLKSKPESIAAEPPVPVPPVGPAPVSPARPVSEALSSSAPPPDAAPEPATLPRVPASPAEEPSLFERIHRFLRARWSAPAGAAR